MSPGAIAGAVVALLTFLFLVVGGFLWWRVRSGRRAAATEKGVESAAPGGGAGPTSPSPVNPRLSRPLEKTPGEDNENPFESTGSVRTGAPSAQSIPIVIASDGHTSPKPVSPTGTTFTGVPQRPARAPDLDIRNTPPFDKPSSAGLEPPRPNYAPSQRTDFTTSTMDSTASSAMEALYESPTIVTGVKRTVIGAARGEVVPVASVGSNPNSPNGSRPLRRTLAGPSPLSNHHFSRGNLPTTSEEDPFADDGMSMRSQSTAMTNMSFGMGTPTPSIRSLQPTIASRVNVASLARSATLRSIGSRSAGLSAAPAQSSFEHPLSTADITETYPPHRPESVQSFASNTDSVLASFPFVPPSPLPTSTSRSPLSVVFTPGESNRESAGSSMFGSENPSAESIPPLPKTPDIAALNSARSSSQVTTAGHSPLSNPIAAAQLEDNELPSPPYVVPARASAMSRESTASSGLGQFDFQFGPGPDEQTTPTSQPQVRSDSNALPLDDKAIFGENASSKVPSSGDVQEERAAARASLDLLTLSRDLTANKLEYD